MARKKSLIPNDFRDFLSLLSFIGFLGIFLAFSFDINWLQSNMTAVFLFIGGTSFLIVGKAVSIRKWIKDGIQQNEMSQLLAIIIGSSAIFISVLLFVKIEIPSRFLGYVGIIALVPAVYTLIDYYIKNTKKVK